jgi:hypothetical protein
MPPAAGLAVRSVGTDWRYIDLKPAGIGEAEQHKWKRAIQPLFASKQLQYPFHSMRP